MTATSALQGSCDLVSLEPVVFGENSFVYAADGSPLGAIPAENNRQPLELAEMSPWLAKATVAIEDRRFYEHSGVDFEGIVRAALENYKARGVVQGGSTITQQLVRNLYRPVGTERTLTRKVREACLALKLDSAWSKDEILQEYMNQIYYGNRAYGVEAAAQTYFSRSATDLTLPEAALIAGLPQAPSFFDPFTRPGEAEGRRNEVLKAMLELGSITEPEYAAAVGDARGADTGKHLHAHQGAVLLQLRAGPAHCRVRGESRAGGRASRLHDDRPTVPASRDEGNPRDADRDNGSGVRHRVDQPGERRDPRDGFCAARRTAVAVQPGRAGPATGGLGIQDLRSDRGDPPRHQPRRDDVHLGTVHVSARSECRGLDAEDLRRHLLRSIDHHGGHPPLRQLGLRALDSRRRSRERGVAGPRDGYPLSTRGCPVDRARLE